MASWLCHLLTADWVHVQPEERLRMAFLLGSVSPDWSAFAEGASRRDSHFKTSVPGEYRVSDFIGTFCLKGDPDRRAFFWGYTCHLILDRLWAQRIYIPLIRGRLRNERAYRRELEAIDNILLTRPESSRALEFLLSLSTPAEALRLAADSVHEEDYRKFFSELTDRYRKPAGLEKPEIVNIDLVDQVMAIAAEEFDRAFEAIEASRIAPM